MSLDTARDREIFERWHGKSLDERVWDMVMPEEGETLGLNEIAAQVIRTRLADQEWQFAAIEGIAALDRAIASDHNVLECAHLARNMIFGSREIPFSSLTEAWNWIVTEQDSEEGQQNGIATRRVADQLQYILDTFDTMAEKIDQHLEHPTEATRLTDEDIAKLKDALDKAEKWDDDPLVSAVCCQYGRRFPYSGRMTGYRSWRLSNLFMQADDNMLARMSSPAPSNASERGRTDFQWGETSTDSAEEIHENKTIGDWMQSNGYFGPSHRHVFRGHPGVMSRVYENDILTEACTVKMLLLSAWSLFMAEDIVRCWSPGQCASYMLTGQTQRTPRMRVWIDNLPGGGKHSFIELNGALNYKEMRELHRILREHTGQYRKKSLQPQDVEILDFVESRPDRTWPQRQKEWNEQHTQEQRYKTANGLLMAHKRAKARCTRP